MVGYAKNPKIYQMFHHIHFPPPSVGQHVTARGESRVARLDHLGHLVIIMVMMVMMMVMVTIKMMVISMRFRRMITMTRRPFD